MTRIWLISEKTHRSRRLLNSMRHDDRCDIDSEEEGDKVRLQLHVVCCRRWTEQAQWRDHLRRPHLPQVTLLRRTCDAESVAKHHLPLHQTVVALLFYQTSDSQIRRGRIRGYLHKIQKIW